MTDTTAPRALKNPPAVSGSKSLRLGVKIGIASGCLAVAVLVLFLVLWQTGVFPKKSGNGGGSDDKTDTYKCTDRVCVPVTDGTTGKYTEKTCNAECDPPPADTYKCTGRVCARVTDGTTGKYTENTCNSECKTPTADTYACTNGACALLRDGSGKYLDLPSCKSACQPAVKGAYACRNGACTLLDDGTTGPFDTASCGDGCYACGSATGDTSCVRVTSPTVGNYQNAGDCREACAKPKPSQNTMSVCDAETNTCVPVDPATQKTGFTLLSACSAGSECRDHAQLETFPYKVKCDGTEKDPNACDKDGFKYVQIPASYDCLSASSDPALPWTWTPNDPYCVANQVWPGGTGQFKTFAECVRDATCLAQWTTPTYYKCGAAKGDACVVSDSATPFAGYPEAPGLQQCTSSPGCAVAPTVYYCDAVTTTCRSGPDPGKNPWWVKEADCTAKCVKAAATFTCDGAGGCVNAATGEVAPIDKCSGSCTACTGDGPATQTCSPVPKGSIGTYCSEYNCPPPNAPATYQCVNNGPGNCACTPRSSSELDPKAATYHSSNCDFGCFKCEGSTMTCATAGGGTQPWSTSCADPTGGGPKRYKCDGAGGCVESTASDARFTTPTCGSGCYGCVNGACGPVPPSSVAGQYPDATCFGATCALRSPIPVGYSCDGAGRCVVDPLSTKAECGGCYRCDGDACRPVAAGHTGGSFTTPECGYGCGAAAAKEHASVASGACSGVYYSCNMNTDLNKQGITPGTDLGCPDPVMNGIANGPYQYENEAVVTTVAAYAQRFFVNPYTRDTVTAAMRKSRQPQWLNATTFSHEWDRRNMFQFFWDWTTGGSDSLSILFTSLYFHRTHNQIIWFPNVGFRNAFDIRLKTGTRDQQNMLEFCTILKAYNGGDYSLQESPMSKEPAGCTPETDCTAESVEGAAANSCLDTGYGGYTTQIKDVQIVMLQAAQPYDYPVLWGDVLEFLATLEQTFPYECIMGLGGTYGVIDWDALRAAVRWTFEYLQAARVPRYNDDVRAGISFRYDWRLLLAVIRAFLPQKEVMMGDGSWMPGEPRTDKSGQKGGMADDVPYPVGADAFPAELRAYLLPAGEVQDRLPRCGVTAGPANVTTTTTTRVAAARANVAGVSGTGVPINEYTCSGNGAYVPAKTTDNWPTSWVPSDGQIGDCVCNDGWAGKYCNEPVEYSKVCKSNVVNVQWNRKLCMLPDPCINPDTAGGWTESPTDGFLCCTQHVQLALALTRGDYQAQVKVIAATASYNDATVWRPIPKTMTRPEFFPTFHPNKMYDGQATQTLIGVADYWAFVDCVQIYPRLASPRAGLWCAYGMDQYGVEPMVLVGQAAKESVSGQTFQSPYPFIVPCGPPNPALQIAKDTEWKSRNLDVDRFPCSGKACTCPPPGPPEPDGS